MHRKLSHQAKNDTSYFLTDKKSSRVESAFLHSATRNSISTRDRQTDAGGSSAFRGPDTTRRHIFLLSRTHLTIIRVWLPRERGGGEKEKRTGGGTMKRRRRTIKRVD